MVRIRLARGGAKKRPFYHIVVSDERSPRDGRHIERLGFFDPLGRSGPERVRLNLQRADHWLAHGARPSDRVAQMIRSYRKGAGQEAPAESEAGSAQGADTANS